MTLPFGSQIFPCDKSEESDDEGRKSDQISRNRHIGRKDLERDFWIKIDRDGCIEPRCNGKYPHSLEYRKLEFSIPKSHQ